VGDDGGGSFWSGRNGAMHALDDASELRDSGIGALGPVPWGAEPCQLYREREELAEVLIPFFAAGLAGNERCLWITGDALAADEVRAALRAGITDFAQSELEGRLEVVDARDWELSAQVGGGWDELREQWLTLESLALTEGYSGLRVASDVSWLVQRARSSTAPAEASVARFEGRRIIALAVYPLDELSATDLLGVLRRHGSCLLRQEQGWEVIETANALLAELAPERPRHSPSGLRLKRQLEPAHTEGAAHRHLQTVQVVSSALCEALTIADVGRVVSAEMADALGARAAAVALAAGDGALSLIPDTAAALGSEPPAATVQRARARRVSAQALVALQVVYDELAASWPSLVSGTVGLPLLCGSRRVGAVVFELEWAHELVAAERALFENIAHQLALALDRARAFELAKVECARAEEASRAKDEFLALLGHELRNPLSPMLTALELMRIRAGDIALKERTIMERQTKHMLRLVDDLLDVSRITRGALPLSRAHVPLSELVERAIELAEPMIEERMHRLEVSLPSEERWLDVDPHRITQALANLLLNAAKYTPSGGAIELTGTVVDARVCISVHDNGVGMDRPLLLRVFEPFVQRGQPPDRPVGGLGLGLTIARHLVELHGGTLSAESGGEGLGSTFSLQLPLAASGRAEIATAPVPSGVHARQRAEQTSDVLNVLVVDDNVDAADMLAEALRARGAEVRVAHDGPRALELIDTFRPQIALLDIGLPGMDGCDLAGHLRARLSDAPPVLVAVTGYGQPSDRARTRRAGFSEHLVKPVDMAQLSALIKNVARHT
jgi:signal transduction histidine kinase/ActR/RegA family two-component response regulator